MITTPSQCPDAQRIFTEMSHHLAIAASFDGYWDATLLVDDVQRPHSACLLLPPRIYLAGVPTHAVFNHVLADLLSSALPADRDAVFYYDSPLWGALLSDGMLPEREVVYGIREHYA